MGSSLPLPGWHLMRSGGLVIVLLLAVLLSEVARAQTDPAPSVGEIYGIVFDCETGHISFQVDVANVPHVPEGTSGFDYPLFYNYTAHYESGGTYFPGRWSVWSPPADQDPYTGTVTLTFPIPLTEIYGVEPGTGTPITSIDLYVGVGTGSDAYASPTDTERTTYVVDCTTTPPPDSPGEVAAYVEAVEADIDAEVAAIEAEVDAETAAMLQLVDILVAEILAILDDL